MKCRKGLSGVLPAVSLVSTFALLLVTPVAAKAPSLAMLGQLDKGLWTLRFRNGAKPSSICVRTGQELIQIRHAVDGCSQYVIEDSPNEVTVQYTCLGKGYGLTNIRRETKALVQIEGSGIVEPRAFEFKAEARRTGDC